MNVEPKPPRTPEQKAIRNEQIKLAATFFNTIAVSFIVTGAIGPAVALAYQVTSPHGRFWAVFLPLWIIMGGLSHLIGRNILRGIEP